MAKSKGFPTFAAVVLVLAILWLLGGMNILKTSVPWIPVVLIIVAIGWIIGHYSKK